MPEIIDKNLDFVEWIKTKKENDYWYNWKNWKEK